MISTKKLDIKNDLKLNMVHLECQPTKQLGPVSVLQVSRDKNCRSKEVKFSLRLQFRQKPQQRCVVKNPELCHAKGHSSLTAPVLMWKKPKERDADSYSPGESAKIFCAQFVAH